MQAAQRARPSFLKYRLPMAYLRLSRSHRPDGCPYLCLQPRSDAALKNIHRRLDQILAGNRHIEQDLARHRRVLNDAHKQIHAVSKGLEKPGECKLRTLRS